MIEEIVDVIVLSERYNAETDNDTEVLAAIAQLHAIHAQVRELAGYDAAEAVYEAAAGLAYTRERAAIRYTLRFVAALNHAHEDQC